MIRKVLNALGCGPMTREEIMEHCGCARGDLRIMNSLLAGMVRDGKIKAEFVSDDNGQRYIYELTEKGALEACG